MDVRAELSGWTDPRVHVQLARREPGLGTVYSLEGTGTSFHVLGVGIFTFLPRESAPLLDVCLPLCRVGDVEAALAGLVLAARAYLRSVGRPVEGDSHV